MRSFLRTAVLPVAFPVALLAPVCAAPEISVESPGAVPLVTGYVTVWGHSATYIAPAELMGVALMSSGYHSMVALRPDHTIVGWGSNSRRQLNFPQGIQGQVRSISLGFEHAVAAKLDGTVLGWGEGYSSVVSPPGNLSNVVAVSAASDHSLALKADGTVTAWGQDYYGQVSGAENLSGVKAISARLNNNLALKTDGTVVAWGRNNHGQTNVPAGLTDVVAIEAGLFSVALKSDGTVVAWGQNTDGQTNIPAGLSGVRSISSNGAATMAVKSDGSVVIWPPSTYEPPFKTGAKQASFAGFGFAATRDSVVDFGNVQVGASNAAKVFTIRNDGTEALDLSGITLDTPLNSGFSLDGTAMAAALEPGETTTFSVNFSPQTVGEIYGNVYIASNDADEPEFGIHLKGRSEPKISLFDGVAPAPETKLVDNNGLLTFPDTPLGTTSAPRMVTVRNDGAAALTNFAVTLSGKFPGEYLVTTPASSSLAPGETTTFAVTFSPTGPGKRPATVSLTSNATDVNSFEIHLSGRVTAPEIAIEQEDGSLIETGKVVVWGWNTHGQREVPEEAQNGIQDVKMGDWHAMAQKRDGTLVGWGFGGNKQPEVPAGLGAVKAISAGRSYNLVLKEDNTVSGWGSTYQGQLDFPTGANALTDIKAISAGLNSGMALKTDGTLRVWGSGEATRVPMGSAVKIKLIAAGHRHGAAFSEAGRLYSWGYAPYRTFPAAGIEYSSPVVALAAANDMSLALLANGLVMHWKHLEYPGCIGITNAVGIAAGNLHYAVLKRDGTVEAFGDNTYGQSTVPAGLHSVSYIGAGDYNTVAIVNTRVQLGNLQAGESGQWKTFVVKNSGNEPLNISGVDFLSGDISHFSVDPSGMLTTVPIGGQTTFKARFNGTAYGTHQAILRVRNNDETEGYYDINLHGSSRAKIEISAGNSEIPLIMSQVIPFGRAPIGVATADKTYTLRNKGSVPLEIASMQVTGADPTHFKADFSGVPASLAPGAEASFTVRFHPVTTGAKTASIRITNNDPENATATFHFNGSGFNATGLNAMQVWRMTYFGTDWVSDSTAFSADHDGDGVSNLLEYAFGTNPTENNPAEQRVMVNAGSNFAFSYRRPVGGAEGVTYDVELSTAALSSWATATESTDYTLTVTPNGDGSETVTVTVALTGVAADRKFARMKVIY